MDTQGRVAGAVLALVLGLAPAALAQDAAPKEARKIYTKKTEFKLPVKIDEQERAGLSGLKLFVKAVPGDWECRESAPATQDQFFFRAPRDGEYWFSFMTVDKAGVGNPATPDQSAPGLIVVVDTRPPEISVRPMPSESGPGYLQCKLIDANPDYPSIKMDCQTTVKGVAGWQPLDPVADLPGVFLAPDKAALEGRVRVRAADLAGNFAESEIDLAPPRPQSPILPVSATEPAKTVVPLPALPAAVPPVTLPPASLPPELVSTQPSPMPPALKEPVTADTKSPPSALSAPSKDIIAINSLHCDMTIAVEPASKTTSEVEVWATPDGARTWTQVGRSQDGHKVRAEFPRDGLYGYAFVIKSENDGQPPAAGDSPDGWIEIDTSKPVAEILSVTLGAGADAGCLLVTWIATDRTFGAEPISLYHASQPNGPWQPLAEKIANTGGYRWALPRGLSGRVYVRMEAVDRAGNTSVCNYPTPVQIESTRPHVKVLSVTAAGKE